MRVHTISWVIISAVAMLACSKQSHVQGEDGAGGSVDWRTYRPLYLGADVPEVEIVLINRPDVPATGAGETAVTVASAAIGNAIFDATGARVRQAPFTPQTVKSALNERT